MRRNYGKKRKLKKIFTAIVLLSAISYAIVVYYKKTSKNDVEIVKINDMIIYKTDITQKINDIFGSENSTNSLPEIDSLPKEVIETFAKEIYLEKKLLDKAYESKLSKDDFIKKQIKLSSDRILIDAYLQMKISQDVSEQAIKDKYAQISSENEGKKQYSISKLVFKSQEEANKAYKALNESKPGKKSVKFKDLEKKYGNLNKESKTEFSSEENIEKEISEVISKSKKMDITKPIKFEDSWIIVRVNDIKESEIESFEAVSENIRQSLVKEVTDKIYQEIFKDLKITYLKLNDQPNDEVIEKQDKLESEKEIISQDLQESDAIRK